MFFSASQISGVDEYGETSSSVTFLSSNLEMKIIKVHGSD